MSKKVIGMIVAAFILIAVVVTIIVVRVSNVDVSEGKKTEINLEEVNEKILDMAPFNEMATMDIDESILEVVGEISKKFEWFKRIDLGESMGNLLLAYYDDISATSRLRVVIDAIKDWVKNSE